ncbi:protein odr-4 homolog, partial [Uloborus diversus]
MGRLIVFDNVVEDKLNIIFRNKGCQTGLIIGQCTDQKDIAIRLCSTPTKDDDVHASTAGDADNSRKSKTNVPDIDEQWICQHAKQLIRALPGGLDILGLFIVAPSEFTTKNQPLLRQVLFSIFKILGKNRSFNLCSSERILLFICPVTMKTVCKTYDVSDYKSFANPAEWKLQSGSMKWHRIRCRLAVDIKFPIKSEDAGLSLQKQIEIGLHPFLENVKEAHAICNGSQRELVEPLDCSNEGKKSKKKSLHESDSSSTPSKWHDIELFIPLENNNNISNPEVCECICMMTFKGAVQCRAYVHSKATVQEAINALKQDIMRSITARFEIHCEDLLLIEEEQQ